MVKGTNPLFLKMGIDIYVQMLCINSERLRQVLLEAFDKDLHQLQTHSKHVPNTSISTLHLCVQEQAPGGGERGMLISTSYPSLEGENDPELGFFM